MALRHSACPPRFLVAARNCASRAAQPSPDGRFALVDQSLGGGAVGEIERRGELRRGNPDDGGLESLGELARDLKTRLVGLVERQADHHGRVCH
ncbi:hypothetical protein ACVJMY_003577 [Bradyrhizobium diazoefficiens]